MNKKLIKVDNNLLITTSVELLEIYDKTFERVNQSNIENISKCNINASLLLNTLYLSLKELLKQMQLEIVKTGGKNRLKKTRKYLKKMKSTNNKKINKGQIRGRNNKQKTKKRIIKQMGGLRMNLITSLLLSILAILTLTQYAASVQPEYDRNVLDRLLRVDMVKDIFENRYGTCSINTALFLGSINLDTYEEVAKNIIERGHGLTYSEISHYLNSSLKTLWEWDLFLVPLRRRMQRRQLRGIADLDEEEIKYERINDYINILKTKMRDIREKKIENAEKGILTALMYPSYGVHHAVVIWLTSDDTLAIIDPQEFVVHGGIVLYSDNSSKYTQFQSKSIEEYFMQNLDYSSDKSTALLMDYHVEREENLMELMPDNEKVKKVIEKMNLLESSEM